MSVADVEKGNEAIVGKLAKLLVKYNGITEQEKGTLREAMRST